MLPFNLIKCSIHIFVCVCTTQVSLLSVSLQSELDLLNIILRSDSTKGFGMDTYTIYAYCSVNNGGGGMWSMQN